MANITLAGIGNIHTDAEGRYSLNDFHKAAGGEDRHAPDRFLRLDSTASLIAAISNSPEVEIKNPVSVTKGRYGGSYVCEELIYAYGEWISGEFHLKVIRAFKALAKGDIEKAQQIARPSTEKPTPLPSATTAFKSMYSLAKLIGLSGNQAILSANNAVFKYHGVNCLNLLDHQALTAEDQRGRTYTATGLGNEFLNMSGRCGAKVNKMLEASGLIDREQATNRPIPTNTGAKHGEWADTGKQHGGAPVKEWRWFSSVVDLIQPIAA